VSGTGTEITADDLANFIKTIIDMANKQNNSYNIGEGDRSIGVVGASSVGPPASLSYDYGRSGLDRQVPRCVSTSCEESISRS
jgi:hypothetical protein